MSLTEIDWNPDKKKLRSFCFVLGLVCTIIAAWYAYKNMNQNFKFTSSSASTIALAIWLPGALSLILGFSRPQTIKPIYILLTAITTPIGIIVNMILLSVIYFLVITPLALFFKIIRRDALNKSSKTADSYWEDLSQSSSKESYFKQF